MSVKQPVSISRLSAVAGFCLLSLGAVEASAWCTYKKTLNEELATDAISSLTVNALAGQLDVTGEAVDKITVVGEVCVAEEEHLDMVRLDVEQKGDELIVYAVIPGGRNGPSGTARIDIAVTLPEQLPLRIFDTSGDVLVRNARIEQIQDSSGDIRVTGGNANLSVEDSSGDVDVRDLTGNLTVRDSSGNIDVLDHHGNVLVRQDSSGDIDLKLIDGTVEIVQDSSGEIEINDVKGDVLIGNDGSGDIRIAHVGGSVNIGSDGSGTLQVTDVDGDLSLDMKGDGRVTARNIAGKTTGF